MPSQARIASATSVNSRSVPLMLIVATHAALLFLVTTAAAELLGGDHGRLRNLPWQTLRVLFANPIVIGLLAGLGFNLLDLAIPTPVDTLARALGGAALPCAVFAVGAYGTRDARMLTRRLGFFAGIEATDIPTGSELKYRFFCV